MIWPHLPFLADMFPDPAQFANLLRNAPGEAMQILEQARQHAREQNPEPDQEPAAPAAPMPGVFEVEFAPPDQQQDADENPHLGADLDSSEDEDEEEEEEEDNSRPFALRMMQGLFGGWGAGPRRPPRQDE
jgi:hypothetical protein